MKQLFTKVFSRDFSLAVFEIGYICESADNKPWLEKPNPYKPYFVFERADGTIHIYYNSKGVEWTNEVLRNKVRKDPSFLNLVEKKVVECIKFIEPIYEKEQALDMKTLRRFIDEFIVAYHWIEAMWWLSKMTKEELGADNRELQKLREVTNKLSAGVDIVIRKSLAREYPKLGLLSAMLGLEEIRSGKIPSEAELRKRDGGFFFTDGKMLFINKEELEREYNIELEQVKVEFVNELKGSSAYKGVVRGSVRRVMGHGDFSKIKQGEILVSPMTMPDFLPAMKKASAFITDEGGMLCHAAIVAREMRKPCITGTKIATQVLKDGDMVEVDADKGIVRKLS